ncbi:FecR family protein [Mucilaginibacter sp. Bleaf8]|uniref:FecR family protein n=1 Tax=Mucilaginibacter sp. Bleaf8 TaxID=2834430 RepID=UPI001BCF9142|nr:FecR family protein [Mucilaginibacter sp. Bleaf8]MBS7562918.1 FecR family protein [Mucilaginibacter sp. Bleaf8]
MTFQEYKDLYERCTTGNCTPEEQQRFEAYHDGFNLSDTPWSEGFGNQKSIEKQLKKDFYKRLHQTTEVKRIRFPYWSAAAAIILIVGGLFYLNYLAGTNYKLTSSNRVKHGTDKATLTLSDGRKIMLNNSAQGILSTENNVLVDKDNAARVIYKKDGSTGFETGQAFNTMTTPRGGKYELVLSDGTKVWLNAATSLRYPVDFAGKERVVELTGEAYFEVAHNKEKPFKVLSNGQVVQVLGTHFNINAYPDEDAIKTTLLEGSVKVFSNSFLSSTKKGALIIKPNEQATFKNNTFSKATVDADDIIAWKNGSMLFKNADVKSIMRQVARWYDVDVFYRGQITDDTYSGEISRNADLDEVVKALKLNDINLQVSGKSIVVLP